MKLIQATYKLLLVLAIASLASCGDHLTDLNVNPNGVDPAVVNPNLIVPFEHGQIFLHQLLICLPGFPVLKGDGLPETMVNCSMKNTGD